MRVCPCSCESIRSQREANKRPTSLSSPSRTSFEGSACAHCSVSSVSGQSGIVGVQKTGLTLYCRKIDTDIVGALKPFVCPVPLCLFQLISLGLGPSLDHEIKTNAGSVDLLVQLAYIASKSSAFQGDQLPEGLSLEVQQSKDGPTVDFDTLDVASKNEVLARLIEELPPIVSLPLLHLVVLH